MDDIVLIVNKVLNIAKKPISFNKICEKVKNEIDKMGINYNLNEDELSSSVNKILENGVENYTIFKSPNGNYRLMSKTSFKKGVFHATRRGDGVVTVVSSYVDDFGRKTVDEKDYSISVDKINGAIDGDVVLIDVGNNKVKPSILNVIERNLENVKGEVCRVNSHYFVKPLDKKKQGLVIFLDGEAIEGQIVSVKLDEQINNTSYKGVITDVLGHVNEPGTDILIEAYKCGIEDKFSDASLEQLKSISDVVLPTEKIGRDDLTDWEIFTIDGADTKDIDDALSCIILPNGNYLVGVHIADVAHYIKRDTPLDKDAIKRGNSYYLGGKVIPMLPPKLSNGICSLNPGVERLAKSCIMEVSPDGKVLRFDIRPTVIRSRKKMTYSDVNSILKNNIVPDGYEDFVYTLNLLNKLALTLRKKRLDRGATEFDRPELHVDMNDNHEVSGFSLRRCDLAENLIEEFMLLANETVDKHIKNCGYPGIHRVHDTPNLDKLETFYKLLNVLNIPFSKYSPEECIDVSNAMQELASYVMSNNNYGDILSLELIKCNSRATYSTNDIGHYGLRLDDYTHFTSPIRRGSDLITHRILNNISNFEEDTQYTDEDLMELSKQFTKTEKVADNAESVVLHMLCSEYMSKHIGEEFEGIITSVSDRNIVVQLDNLIEGRVSTRSLNGPYIYYPESFSLVSIDGKNNYTFGDRVRVRVKDASKENKTIDFEIIEKIYNNDEKNNVSNDTVVYTYKKRK